ncbi:RHS repeat-associated core domain-containing protein [Burkholderia stabilis]|uniref:RHS repeat-associated core domain-containing protein n=1 Tax=Burkholderia stabilis TaxID=95485 RepID=UPI0009F58931|nr:RHS repeat-associated core domain-containing protein [Burkholderia stabilis]
MPERNEATNPIRFPGQYHDEETGLHYNRHRYYDPDIGRYVSKDPIQLSGGLNVYAYVDGNPIAYVDPLGLVNPAKVTSCSINAMNAGRLYGSGALKLAASVGLDGSGVGAPAGVGVGAWGLRNLKSAGAAWQRARQQCQEAGNEKFSDARWRNLLGVLSYGTEFDDEDEPSPIEFAKKKAGEVKEKPLEILREI